MEKIKVIIVDDESMARDIIIAGTDWEAVEVEAFSASDGKEAMESIVKNNIQIVITDIKMPVMDGLELIRQIKEWNPRIICIVMSSYNEFELVRQSMRLGAVDYLFKPAMMPEDILNVILKFAPKLENPSAEIENKLKKPVIRTDIFKILMQDSMLTKTGKKELVQTLNMNDVQSVYVIRMILSQYQNKLKRTFLSDYEMMRFTIENIVNEVAADRFGLEIQAVNFYDYYFIIWNTQKKKNTEKIKKEFENFTNELIFDFMKYYKMKTYFGVSHEGEDFDLLFDLQLQASEAVKQAYTQDKPLVFYGEADKTLSDKMLLALDYISDNLLNNSLSLQTVADYVGISKNYLSKIFKEEMNINFVDYVTGKKLERARDIYLSTDKKIYEIAEELGYSDWHYLYALYKKEYGYSLSREKEKIENGPEE